jgi:hypothetical protein
MRRSYHISNFSMLEYAINPKGRILALAGFAFVTLYG